MLIVTVLLISAAASIAYAISYQASLGLAGEHTRAGRSAAADAAAAAREEVELALAADPLGFTRVVLPSEAQRRCLSGPFSGELFSPGDLWPGSCGTSWSYALPAADWTGTRVEITSPSSFDGALTVTTRVQTAPGVESSQSARYLPSGAGRFIWASTGAVSLASIPASDTVSLTGALYAAQISDAPAAGLLLSGVLAGESVGTPSAISGVSWFGPTPAVGPPAVGDLRTLLPSPLTPAHLGSLTTALELLGCPGSEPAELPGGLASHLCLAPGATLLLADGGTTTVPDSARAFLVVPTVDGKLQVWYADAAPSLGATSPLLCGTPPSSCSLGSHTATLSASSAHPGHSSFWSSGLLGTLAPPANGLLASSASLYVGRCDGYGAGEACAALGGGSDPGVTFGSDLTVVAPTVVVGSPLHAAPGVDVALAASGELHLAYWSRPAAGVFVVEAHLLGAGGVDAFPAVLSSSGSSDQNWDASLSLTGSVTGADLSLGFAGWRSVELVPVDSSFSAPPWFAAASWGWERVTVEPSAAAARTFSPTSVPGLLLWLDANDPSSQSFSSGQLTSWEDKSRRGNDAATSAPGNPSVVSNPAGSVLSFAGTASSLTTTAAPRTGAGAMTLTAVVSAGSGPVISWGGTGAGTRTLSLLDGAPRYSNGSATVSSPASLGAGLHVVTVTLSPAGSATVYVDGLEVASGTAVADTSATPASIGAAGSSYFTGKIAEIVVYNQVLTPLENTRLTDHLLAKWSGS